VGNELSPPRGLIFRKQNEYFPLLVLSSMINEVGILDSSRVFSRSIGAYTHFPSCDSLASNLLMLQTLLFLLPLLALLVVWSSSVLFGSCKCEGVPLHSSEL